MTPSNPLTAALTRLGAAFDDLDVFRRLELARTLLTAAREDSGNPPEVRAFYVALYMLTEDASIENLEHVVSTLEVSSDLRAGVRATAGNFRRKDPLRARLWSAVADVAAKVRPT
jgi:hypothetical protein